ncbi:Cyclin-A3-1 [Platanthera guangdongensis]|uniref:Cyclin-A3-1 n=1 Tax=Platanthera guangdongensis TaxID=2320717 RepID=A0ABR2LTW2_9ASPA
MADKEDVPPASASKKRAAFAIIGSPLQHHRRPLAELPPRFRKTVQMKNVSASMRGILVDWLVEVAEGFCAFPAFSWLRSMKKVNHQRQRIYATLLIIHTPRKRPSRRLKQD